VLPPARALFLLLVALFTLLGLRRLFGLLRLLDRLGSSDFLPNFSDLLALGTNSSYSPDDIIRTFDGDFVTYAVQHLNPDIVLAEYCPCVLSDFVGIDDGVCLAENKPDFL
jgi:hypothetical protein